MVDRGHWTLMQDLGSTLDAALALCFYYLHKQNNMGMDADSMLCINRRFLIICYFYHLAPFCSFMSPLLLFIFMVVQRFIPAYTRTHTDIYPGTNLPRGAALISARHKVDRKSFLCITGLSTLPSRSAVSYSLFPAEKLLYHRGNLTFWGIGVI